MGKKYKSNKYWKINNQERRTRMFVKVATTGVSPIAHKNMILLGADVVSRINHLDKPCKTEVVGWIPGFSSLWVETLSCGSSPYDLSYWWDV